MLSENYRQSLHKRVKIMELLNERQLRLLSVVNIAYHYSLKQSVTYRPYDRRKVEDFCDLIVTTS